MVVGTNYLTGHMLHRIQLEQIIRLWDIVQRLISNHYYLLNTHLILH